MKNLSNEKSNLPHTGIRGRLIGWYRNFFGRLRAIHFVIIVLFGAVAGIGFFTLGYGKGLSYLSNNPASCANCHVMQDHFDSWNNSSHKDVATCNDCHLSHHPVGKWITKGDNGFFHSLAFTTGNYHKPIQIKDRNRKVTQNACLYCHEDFVHNMLPKESGDDMLLCIHCHTDVGHSQRR